VTALQLIPAGVPAPAARRIWSHALTEARLLVRNGEQLLLALVIPVAVLVTGRLAVRTLLPMPVLAPSVLALAVWSSGFTSTAIATGFERRYGVLERLAASPLGRSGLVFGKTIAVVLVMLGQVAVIAVVAFALGWRPVGGGRPTLIMIIGAAAAVTTFVSAALILAGRLRAEATLAVANLVYLVLAAGGAIVVPLTAYPARVQPVIRLLPTAAWAEVLRNWSSGTVAWWPVLVLVIWAAVATAVAQKVFQWIG